MKKRLIFALFAVLTVVQSCAPGGRRVDVDVSGISVPDVRVHRYDLDLFKVRTDDLLQDLETLKPAYRFFLGTDLNDPLKLAEMRVYLENPRNQGFYEEVSRQYPDAKALEKSLTEAFRHYRYYFPQASLPRVYSYISGGDYEFPVQYADSVMLIGLDNYLGVDFSAYLADGLPLYRIARTEPGNIVPDCMRVLASITYPETLPGNNLLDQMVAAGKRIYFTEAMVPGAGDRFLIGYTAGQQDWITKNAAHVWAAIIENRMLFSTDGQLIRTFMADGPFTAEFSKDAPARLGAWIGWQIVRHYMDRNPEVTLDQLMQEQDAQKVLTLSKYKPEK
jgi:hypothetical protein